MGDIKAPKTQPRLEDLTYAEALEHVPRTPLGMFDNARTLSEVAWIMTLFGGNVSAKKEHGCLCKSLNQGECNLKPEDFKNIRIGEQSFDLSQVIRGLMDARAPKNLKRGPAQNDASAMCFALCAANKLIGALSGREQNDQGAYQMFLDIFYRDTSLMEIFRVNNPHYQTKDHQTNPEARIVGSISMEAPFSEHVVIVLFRVHRQDGQSDLYNTKLYLADTESGRLTPFVDSNPGLAEDDAPPRPENPHGDVSQFALEDRNQAPEHAVVATTNARGRIKTALSNIVIGLKGHGPQET